MNDEKFNSVRQNAAGTAQGTFRRGGVASGITRARHAYMRSVAEELVMRCYVFNDTKEEIAAFRAWKRRKKKAALILQVTIR